MLVSLVIPAYNASNTMSRCLDSIYSLDLEEYEYEVIVIDDCSTDNTVRIIEDYQEEHENLVLFRQSQNHRQGAARNIGIDKAKGDFVIFVDSDDEVGEGLWQAVKMADEKSCDMVAMRVAKISGEGMVEVEMSLPYLQEQVVSGIELQSEHPFWFTGPVAYVYRMAFLLKVNYRFAEDVLFEDSDFVNVHLYHAKRMAYSDTCGYRAHFNSGSTTHTMSYKHLADYALLGTRMLAFYESLPDKTTKYADSILEGGSYNVMKSFRKIFRLESGKNVQAFYDRFDSYFDRKQLLRYRKPTYCWTWWTRFCVRYRWLTMIIVGISIPVVRYRNNIS